MPNPVRTPVRGDTTDSDENRASSGLVHREVRGTTHAAMSGTPTPSTPNPATVESLDRAIAGIEKTLASGVRRVKLPDGSETEMHSASDAAQALNDLSALREQRNGKPNITAVRMGRPL